MRTQVNALLQRLSHAVPLTLPVQKASTVAHSAARTKSHKPVWETPASPEPRETRHYDVPHDIPAVVGKVIQVAEDVLLIADGDLRATIRLQGLVFSERDPRLRALAHARLQSLIGSEVLAAGYQGTSGIDIVARLMDGDTDVNHQLLLAGLARYDESDARALNQRDRVLYAQAERQARAARQGIWRNGRR